MPGTDRRGLIGVGLALLLALAVAWVGSVEPTARAGLHVGVVGLLAVGLTLPTRVLRRGSPGVERGLVALLPLLVALGLGLVPLPVGLAAWVAPGRLALTPEAGWVWAAGSVPDLGLALCGWALVAAVWCLAVVWVDGTEDSHDSAEWVARGLVVGVLALVGLGAVHAAFGLQDAFGWIPTSRTLTGPYFGPLVNPNHVGTAVALATPVAVHRALGQRSVAAGVLVLLALPVLVVTEARGAALVAVAGGLWAALRTRGLPWKGLAVGLGALVLGGLGLGLALKPVDSVGSRLRIWADSVDALGAHWLLGVGGGGFERALEPYRSDTWANAIAHAHNDWLEWVVETGAVGALCLVLALGLGLRAVGRPDTATREMLLVGVLAVLGHALVEFPLAIPALALAVVVVLAGARAGRRPRPGATRRVRGLLSVLLLGNLVAAAICSHQGAVDRAVAGVRGWDAVPERGERDAAWLEQWAPGSPWPALQRAWSAVEAGELERAADEARAAIARSGADDDVVRPAGLVLVRVAADDGLDVARLAVALGPADYRNHILLARAHRRRGEVAEAVAAYVHAFHLGAPQATVREAWATFPVSVSWLEALEDLPGPTAALGALWISEADPQEALLAFDQAARTDPATYGDIAIRPRALVRTGAVEEALAAAAARCERKPEEPVSWWVLGDVRYTAGDHGGAAEAWRRVEDDLPEVRPAIVGAVGLAEGSAAARLEADRLRMSGRGSAAVQVELARVLAREGDAHECAAVAEALDPSSPEGAEARALCAANP